MVLRKVHVLSSGARNFTAKLAPDWEGPYKIVEVKPPNVYILDMEGGSTNPKVYVIELKKYRGSRGG